MTACCARIGRPTLLEDRSAVVALEFVLIVPFMMVLYFGCVETTQLVRAVMGLGVATQSMADLLSHGDPDTTAQVNDACEGAKLVMAPFSKTGFKAAITAVKNLAGTPTVSWTNNTCGTATAITGAVTIATPMVPVTNDEVIIVTTAYTYNAFTSYVLKASFNLSYTAYARPRVPPP